MTLTMLEWVVTALIGAGVLLVLYRVVRGPTILDRMIASDVLLTTVMVVLGTWMVVDGHTDLLPVLLVLAATASYGTIAVARAVSRHDGGESGVEADRLDDGQLADAHVPDRPAEHAAGEPAAPEAGA